MVALLQKLVMVTDGTFQLEPEAFLNLERHSAVLVRWWAERKGRRSEGREIAVYCFEDGKIAEVWFYNEPSEMEAFSAVFASTEGGSAVGRHHGLSKLAALPVEGARSQVRANVSLAIACADHTLIACDDQAAASSADRTPQG